MANPSVNHHYYEHTISTPTRRLKHPDTPPHTRPMKHNPGISLDWTKEEQLILQEGLTKFASVPSLTRYAKIALQLRAKTVRDVALRVRWINRKENGRKRKNDHSLSRKSKDNKEKVSDPATRSSPHSAAQPSVSPPYAPAMSMTDNDDDISFNAIGGPAGELLEQNARALTHISENPAAFQWLDNMELFCQIRDNFITILNDCSTNGGLMRKLPPLPVKWDEALANCMLPKSNHQMLQH